MDTQAASTEAGRTLTLEGLLAQVQERAPHPVAVGYLPFGPDAGRLSHSCKVA